MSARFLGSFSVVGAVIALAAAPLAQAPASPTKAKPAAAQKAWTPPRTADGQPDLQGVWANNNATPLERPQAFAGRPLLTDAEVAVLKAKAGELFSGDGDAGFGEDVFTAILAGARTFTSSDAATGNYNQFWLADRDFDNRTSLVTDPADGRIPPLTPEAQRKQAALPAGRNQIASGPEDRSLSERCITFGVPRLGAGYNSYYQIVQSPEYVAIAMETIHDTRIIPLDGRPHVGPNIRQWHGNSVGHWEGATLVIDTTNYSPKSNFRGAHENLHVIERLTRVSPARIDYQITADDPTTWTRQWTAMIPLKLSDELIYEYACHERNDGLAGILAGARAQEKAAAEGAKREPK